LKWLTLDLEPSFPNRYGRCGGFAFVRVKSTTLGHNPYRFFGRQQWLFDIAHASLASELKRSNFAPNLKSDSTIGSEAAEANATVSCKPDNFG
jgi:hypothetical protein